MIQLIGTLTSPSCWLLHDWEVDSTSFFFNVCIPLEWVGRVMIAYVGSPQKEDLLRSKLFIRFFFLMLEEHLED
jgi:hypothetical protein